MVLLSGLTLAFVVLLIAGAAAAAPKDADSPSEQRTVVAGLTNAGANEDSRPEELSLQNRRTKRGRSNAAFESSEEEEEPFWAARGRRARLGTAREERLDGQVGDTLFPRPYGLRWVFPQKRAVGSSEEDDAPFWASRGRRCCNQVKGVADLKRGYGKDRVRALVAKIIAGSGGRRQRRRRVLGGEGQEAPRGGGGDGERRSGGEVSPLREGEAPQRSRRPSINIFIEAVNTFWAMASKVQIK